MPTTYMGDLSIEAGGLSSFQNLIFCQQVSLISPATLQSISIYIDTDYGANMRMGVYNDSAGSPNLIQAQTVEFNPDPATGWYTKAVITPVLLSPATYWLALKYPSDSFVFRRQTVSGTTKRYALAYNNGTFPSPAAGPWTSETMTVSWYASLTITTPVKDTAVLLDHAGLIGVPSYTGGMLHLKRRV